jgi:mannitol/fructose-specific phosphotransferase system IIA component (Ntr-type)
MRLQELFRPEDILVDFDPVDKWDAIARLVQHLVRQGRVPAARAEELQEAVLARERSMSTGMEHGIAIPHAAVDDLDPTQLVVLLLIPRKQKLLHIRTLADVARALVDEEVRAGLFTARDAQQAWRALGRAA